MYYLVSIFDRFDMFFFPRIASRQHWSFQAPHWLIPVTPTVTTLRSTRKPVSRRFYLHMGNSVSNNKERHGDEVVDFGHLSPQGVYTAPQDWNQEVVANLIIDRKLAPFYRPLEEYNDSWDEEQILAARKPLPESHPHAQAESTPSGSIGGGSRFHHKQSSKAGKEVFRPSEASIYRGAVECPICFLVCTLFRHCYPFLANSITAVLPI